ncbi:MAG: hypothetical protein K2X55_19555 [Burkholderiaceae bacterium]|nr:hypothetical protein [Burkholderiaceae bacterium]
MIDLLPILMDATRTVQLHMKQWFASYPAGMPWTIVSDYCIGDETKRNDGRSQKPSATPICCKVLQCQETMSI